MVRVDSCRSSTDRASNPLNTLSPLDGHQIWTTQEIESSAIWTMKAQSPPDPDEPGLVPKEIAIKKHLSLLYKFKQWLVDNHPGFHRLSPLEQKDQTLSHYDQYAIYARLPPLPSKEPRIFVMDGQVVVPNAKLKALTQNLETKLTQIFLFNPDRSNCTLQLSNLITQLRIMDKIDDFVVQFLCYTLSSTTRNLVGAYQLYHNLVSHVIQYSLNNVRLADSSVVGVLKAIEEICINDGYRFIRLLTDPDLLQDFIDKIETYISNNPPEIQALILDAVRTACRVDTLCEMIYNRIHSLLSDTVDSWNNLDRNECVPNIDPFSKYNAPQPSQGPVTSSRIAHLETKEPLEILELYCRFFIPKTTAAHYNSIKDLYVSITQPETLLSIANRTEQPVRGRCTRKDLKPAHP